MVDIPSPMRPDFRGSPVVFLQEVRAELTKVSWPNRDQVIKLTIVVIVVSLILGMYIGGLDLVFTRLTDIVIGK